VEVLAHKCNTIYIPSDFLVNIDCLNKTEYELFEVIVKSVNCCEDGIFEARVLLSKHPLYGKKCNTE
jgi:hypothetical protein